MHCKQKFEILDGGRKYGYTYTAVRLHETEVAETDCIFQYCLGTVVVNMYLLMLRIAYCA